MLPATGVVSVPKLEKLPAPLGLSSKRTAETPEAGGDAPSLPVASTSTVPERKAAAAGEVTAPAGAVLSTYFGSPGRSTFETLLALSVTTARRS